MGLRKFLAKHGIEVIDTDAGIHLRSTGQKTEHVAVEVEKPTDPTMARPWTDWAPTGETVFDGIPPAFPGEGIPKQPGTFCGTKTEPIDWHFETTPQEDSVAPPVKRGSLIGLGGNLRHGKDEVADALVLQFDFQKYGMSDPLNEALLVLNPIVVATTKIDRNGESDRVVADKIYYRDLHDKVGYVEAKKNPEVRRLLQMLGTDVGRNMIDSEVWVKIARERIEKTLSEGKNVVITAIRFPNELTMVQELGGALVWVHRPGKEFEPSKDAHASETSVSVHQFPIRAYNDGTLEQIPTLAEELFLFIKDNTLPKHGYTGGHGYVLSAKSLSGDARGFNSLPEGFRIIGD